MEAERLEAMAAALEATGRYRVYRQLQPSLPTHSPDGIASKTGLFIDVETTGLDPQRHEIIELAMMPFTYGTDGQILSVGVSFEKLRQPSLPIPPEITALTGIDDKMVAGHSIDPAEVARFIAPAAFVIAHNAAFDRRFLERFCDGFATKPWGCSMTQIDWAGEGFEGTKLAYLAMGAGFFYERHRASADCLAAITLLSRPLPRSGAYGLAKLLERARTPTWRIWAEHAPFDLKDVLKERGYRWNADGNGAPRAWWIDVTDEARDRELAYLKSEIYQRDVELLVRRIDAYDRFSDRC